MSYSFELGMDLLYFAILAATFIYGAISLLKPGKPLYFQLFVLASGCRMLERLIVVVLLICGFDNPNVSIGAFLGTFSMVLFVLAANYGTLDSLVDDRSDDKNKKARRLALIAPIILTSSFFVIVPNYIKNVSLFTAIILTIAFIPCIPASYFNLKHLLLPKDEMGLLEATKYCNVVALLAYVVGIANNFLASLFVRAESIMYVRLVVYTLPALLIVAAVKGAKQWKI